MGNAESLEKDVWKPMRAPWAVQMDVVDSMIMALEGDDPQLDDVVEAIYGTEAIHTSHAMLKDSVRGVIKSRYTTVFEEGGREKLLADLRLQKKWFEEHPDKVLLAFRGGTEVYKEIQLSNDKYLQAKLAKDIPQGE